MNKKIKKLTNNLKNRFLCVIGKHHYVTTQELDSNHVRLACPCCGGVWAFAKNINLMTEWISCFHKLYESFGKIVTYKYWEFKKNYDYDRSNETPPETLLPDCPNNGIGCDNEIEQMRAVYARNYAYTAKCNSCGCSKITITK